MENFGIWGILTVISVIGLIFFRRKRNAVWGGLTIGAIVGFIITIIYFFKGENFNWAIIWKSSIVGIMFGILSELLALISIRLKRKS